MFPSLYIDFFLLNMLPPQLVCVRAGTTANHFTRSGRLVQSIANEPRLTPDGLLIEPSSENLFLYSRDLTQWTATGTGTISQSPSLDGTLRNNKIGSFSSSATYTLEETVSLTGTYTLSFYAQNTSVGNVSMKCEFGGQTVYISNNRKLYQMTTTTSATSVKFTIVTGAVVGAAFVTIDSVQIEAGTKATSPIHTSGSTQTRNADEIYINVQQAAVNNWFTRLGGTFLVDAKTNNLTTEETLLHLVNTTTGATDYMRLGLKRTSGTQVNMGYNNSNDYSFFSSCDNPTQNFRVGTSFTDGEQLVSLVGRTNTSGSSTQSIDFSDINRLYLGRLSGGTNLFCGTIRRLGFYPLFVDQINLNNLTNI